MLILQMIIWSFIWPEPKTNWNQVCNFGCQSCFWNPFFQKMLIYDFLAENNNLDSPHSQGGMKFPTQISPLLNNSLYSTNLLQPLLLCTFSYQSYLWSQICHMNRLFWYLFFHFHYSIKSSKLSFELCKQFEYFFLCPFKS